MLKIGIIGHRNLNEGKLKQYKIFIHNQLEKLKLGHKDLIIYSSLADGADRLMIHVAIELKIDFVVVLPMEKEKYNLDFSSESKKEFNELSKEAIDTIIMLDKNNSRESQYELAGKYLSDNSDILFALWDGKYNDLQGGTSETVKYHLNKNKQLWHLKVDRGAN